MVPTIPPPSAPPLVSLQISQSRTTSRSISIPQRRKKKLLSLPKTEPSSFLPRYYYSFVSFSLLPCRPWITRAASSPATPPSRSSGKTVSERAYRAEKKSLQTSLSRTQAGPVRKVKQEQEEISRNHVPRLFLGSVQAEMICKGCVIPLSG